MLSMSTKASREAWRAMHQLMFGDRGHAGIEQVAAASNMTPGLMRTLFLLQPGDGVPMRDLADHWRCDASYVTSLADDLEQRGLAERRPHPTDRRVKMIVITDAGVAAKERAFELLFQPPASFGALTPTEQRRLRDLLRKVADADADLARDRPADSR